MESWKNHGAAFHGAVRERIMWRMEEVGEDEIERGGLERREKGEDEREKEASIHRVRERMGEEPGSSRGGKKEVRWKLLPMGWNWLGVKCRDGKFEAAVYDENSPSKLAIKSFNTRVEASRLCGESWKNHEDSFRHALRERIMWRMEEVGEGERERGGVEEDERESGGERKLREKGNGKLGQKGVGEDERESGGEREVGENGKGEDEKESGGVRGLGEKGKGVKKKKGLSQKIKDGFKKMLVFKSKRIRRRTRIEEREKTHRNMETV
ncbi:uncharacterized protein LOC110008067 [Amborella trichopoda]|uniref:uncharacterized protein LOC110008067 n=1 Tax=Amborella trichopoda TaxID=13333 RepID=UPI0009C15A1B|nr:uncharacterized protein LOC110008067 [Amborella trichopoda]|eukprot:XP_020528880.1 uncharacterized protein LOC110008067 [Amborella trichopoda]